MNYLVSLFGYTFMSFLFAGVWFYLTSTLGLSSNVTGAGIILIVLTHAWVAGIKLRMGSSFFGAYHLTMQMLLMSIGITKPVKTDKVNNDDSAIDQDSKTSKEQE